MDDLAKNLAALRRARKLTQQQLASLLGVQVRLVSRWETGESKPHLDSLVKLSEILEVSLDALVRGDDSGSPRPFDIANRKLKELCRRVDKLPMEDQNVICHVMDSLVRKGQAEQPAPSGTVSQR
jgi:transcriptional regulator with XRE-family HTH domain